MISILISSCRGGITCELCIESILKRTRGIPYKIIVFDSTGPSPELDYLQEQERRENIRLLTAPTPKTHGHAIEQLLGVCNTTYGFILDSDIEIINGNWLKNILTLLRSYKDLGVAKFRSGSFNFGMPDAAFAPTFWAAHMLLNMDNYRNLGFTGSWIGGKVPIENYLHRNELLGKDMGQKFIYYDTAAQFTEKVLFDNPNDYRMILQPANFWHLQMTHYGGISSNWPELKSPRIALRLQTMQKRLQALRNES